jgi:signal transduction histidine kinase
LARPLSVSRKASTTVSNVIPFVSGRAHAAAAVLDAPDHAHAVQFYDGEDFLFDTVARFLGAGLQAGDVLVVIATSAHSAAMVQRTEALGARAAIAQGRFLVHDARQTLAKFMVGGMPDPDLFRDVLSRVITDAKSAASGARLRAYGEMVDLLWRDGNPTAAIRLEELWNEAGKEHSFSLLCAYQMGNFYKEGDASRFLEVCRNHSHVIPTESFSNLDDASARLREISLLQQRARALESEIDRRKELEKALRDALRERSRVEEELRASVKREKKAREEAEANDSFKEMFLAMLGHDLRNPLSSILATARLMILRRELLPESQKRVERLISSGERMHRMIGQILDVTRARLGDGIKVEADQVCDLSVVVGKILEEVRAAHPGRTVELHVDGGPCQARIDCGRFEQVVSNLLGNAMTHGDPAQPVRVGIAQRGDMVSVTVHNEGPPIAADFLPVLFDPFRRGKPSNGSDGLGLGLFISERIVRAHGGEILVESSAEGGTRFEAVIPRRS